MYRPSPTSISNTVALSLWSDNRDQSITRESAARVAERWQAEKVNSPKAVSADWQDGWEMACETIALALRFKA